MTRPSIDEQIEAVAFAHSMLRHDGRFPANHYENMKDAMRTLLWVKRYAPTIKALKEQFPDAKFTDRSEED